jgi:molybdopterin-containing oxidoreductase family iron-sulfur binding subunit
MKTIPPQCTEPETGPKYWRSLEQLSDAPEFRQWVEREFPAGASEWTDPVSRRNFVKVMSASFLLAGLGATGCRRPVEKIYPFAKMPENYTYGVPQYYATAMPSRRGAVPLVVKSNEGRPTKIEGNPDLPDSNGGTDPMTQASVLSLYDPDRAMHVKRNGAGESRAAALDFLQALGKGAGDGSGFGFLLEQSSSPSRARLQQALSAKLPRAAWYVHEPIDLDLGRQAASMSYNGSGDVEPYYKLDEARVIVALDCDFIGSEQDAHGHIRRFAKGRALDGQDDSMSRLYAVESLFTLTGLNADHRLRVPPSLIVPVMARLALNVLKSSDVDQKLRELAAPAEAHDAWIVPCADDLKANPGKSLVMAGYRLPLAAHLLAVAMNDALGAVNHTVEFHPTQASPGEAPLMSLAAALNAGQIQTLVILGGNPGYTAPAELNWPQAQAKAKTVIRLGYHEDETAWDPALHADTQWDLPMAHYLESWGDARTADGTLVPIQPLINPLFGGITELEVLALIAGEIPGSAYEIVRETFRSLGGAGEDDWGKFLHDGFLANSAAAPASVQYSGAELPRALNGLQAGGHAVEGQSGPGVLSRFQGG